MSTTTGAAERLLRERLAITSTTDLLAALDYADRNRREGPHMQALICAICDEIARNRPAIESAVNRYGLWLEGLNDEWKAAGSAGNHPKFDQWWALSIGDQYRMFA